MSPQLAVIGTPPVFLQRQPTETPLPHAVRHHCVVTSSLQYYWAAPSVTLPPTLIALIDDSTTFRFIAHSAPCADNHAASRVSPPSGRRRAFAMRPGDSLGNPAVPCVDDRTVFRISPPTVRRQVVATTPGGFMGVTATPRDGDRTAFRDLPSLRHDQQLFVMSPDHSISDPATPRADDCVALCVSPSSVRCHAFVLPQQRSLISNPTTLRADDRATFPHFDLIVFFGQHQPQ